MADSNIADVLFNRFAKLHHAINLRDFSAYCHRRALLSRGELSKTTSEFTAFYSDTTDKERGLWERVFGNLQDFGFYFWAAPGCTPNAYGPITLVFCREAWRQIDDITVTRKNAATRDFDLATDKMPMDELASCFERNKKNYWQLNCNGLEVSLGTSFLSLDFVEQVIVEPVFSDFVDKVRDVWTSSGFEGVLVVPRTLRNNCVPEERRKVFAELVNWSASFAGNVPISTDLKNAVPSNLKEWANQLRDSQWAPLRQWLEYTYKGTLK